MRDAAAGMCNMLWERLLSSSRRHDPLPCRKIQLTESLTVPSQRKAKQYVRA